MRGFGPIGGTRGNQLGWDAKLKGGVTGDLGRGSRGGVKSPTGSVSRVSWAGEIPLAVAVVDEPDLGVFSARVTRAREHAEACLQEGDELPEDRVWAQTQDIVLGAAERYWRNTRVVPPPPTVTATPDGMVDIVWESGNRRILITVIGDPPDVATFHGRDRAVPRNVVQGEIDSGADDEHDWILAWLLG